MAARRSRTPLVVEHRPANGSHPALEIRSSIRRRKTATAWWEGTTLVVAMPAHVRGKSRDEMITWLVERSQKRRPSLQKSDPELLVRALELVEQYEIGASPTSVRFVTNQNRRWGSCTPETGAIRLTHRLQAAPSWVLDAVLVHELAHLVYGDHGPEFHELANRHPRQAEATLFLEGFQIGFEMGVEDGHEISRGRSSEIAPALAGRDDGDAIEGPPLGEGPSTLF